MSEWRCSFTRGWYRCTAVHLDPEGRCIRHPRRRWRPKAVERLQDHPWVPAAWSVPPFPGVTYRRGFGSDPQTGEARPAAVLVRGALRDGARRLLWTCDHDHTTFEAARICAAKERPGGAAEAS